MMLRRTVRKRWLQSVSRVAVCLYALANLGAGAVTPGSGRSLIVAIGNGQYRYWGTLNTPERDAGLVVRAFARFGYVEYPGSPHILARREELIKLLAGLRSEASDNLIFYFAGHGTIKEGRAYLVPLSAPVDAKPDELISVENDLLPALDAVAAAHVFVILDSCKSGLSVTNSRPRSSAAGASQRARILLTSAMGGQNARDDGANGSSLFTGYLLLGLNQHECDTNHDGVCTSSELSHYLQARVLNASASDQIPDFARFRSDSGGDLLFELHAHEIEHWRKVADSKDPDVLREYARQHPASPYTEVANARIREIERDLLAKGALKTRQVANYSGPVAGHPITNLNDGLVYRWIPANPSRGVPQPFWIGETEVTVAAYKRFEPALESRSHPPGFNKGWQFPDQPVVNVSWDDARRFCLWTAANAGRLPTGQEWEHAARGTADRLAPYPWIGTASKLVANVAATRYPYIRNVGKFTENTFKLHDVIGNVAEWTSEPASRGKRVARGGSFADTWDRATITYSWRLEPQGDNRVGFRCVIAPQSGSEGGTNAVSEGEEAK